MFDIITFGSATRDAFFYSKNFRIFESKDFVSGRALCFNLGSKVEVDRVVFATGGGGTNTACGFSRLGLKTAALCQVGDDVSGRAVLEDLEKDRVETKYVFKTKSFNTAYSVILSALDRERTILVYRGASENIVLGLIPFAKLKSKWFYLSSLGGDFSLLEKIFSFAQKNKIKVAINPGAKELERLYDLLSLAKKADLLILNQEEAAKLSGISFRLPLRILKKLDEEIKGIVVMTSGKTGSYAAHENKIYQAGVLETEVRERTGAGDAFGCGFLAGLIFRNDLRYALQLGTANATAVISQIGAKNGLLSKGSLRTFGRVAVKIF